MNNYLFIYFLIISVIFIYVLCFIFFYLFSQILKLVTLVKAPDEMNVLDKEARRWTSRSARDYKLKAHGERVSRNYCKYTILKDILIETKAHA